MNKLFTCEEVKETLKSQDKEISAIADQAKLLVDTYKAGYNEALSDVRSFLEKLMMK